MQDGIEYSGGKLTASAAVSPKQGVDSGSALNSPKSPQRCLEYPLQSSAAPSPRKLVSMNTARAQLTLCARHHRIVTAIPCSACHLHSLSSTVRCLQGTSGRKDVASQLAKQQRKALLLQQVITVAQALLAWPLRILLFA